MTPRDPAPPGLYTGYAGLLDLWVTVRVENGMVTRVRLDETPPEDAVEQDHPLLERVMDHVLTGKDGFEDVDVDLSELPAFQQNVLKVLRHVPPGRTVSYGELAARVGRPGAARAVGNAVARNPAPIVVPCHRVVAGDGSLGGYSGGRGEETKARLLSAEGAL